MTVLGGVLSILIAVAQAKGATAAQTNLGPIAALAKVGDQVLTTRDLQINLFLNEMENPLALFSEKKEPMKEIIWEYLIYKESIAVADQGASASEVQSAFQKFKKRVENDRLWNSLQVGDKALREAIERKLTVKRLITLKIPEELVTVDDESIESYYLLNRNQLGHRPLSEVRETIIQALKNQKLQERFRDWIAAMTRTHGVVHYSGVKIQ